MEARQKTRKDKTVVLFDKIEPRSVEQAVRRINDLLFGIIESRTSITREMLDEVAKRKKDWFITATEALELGIITEIIG